MTVIRMLGLAGLAVALPVLAAAQDTTYDYDRTANFTQYHTYALKAGTSSGDPLMDERIITGLETQLAYKGLRKADTSPDVYVEFHMTYDTQKEFSSYSYGPMYGGYGWGGWSWGWGGGWGWGSTMTEVRVRDILVGTLAVDMIDARRSKLVWRGTATKEVDTDDDAHDRDKAVAKALAKIFKHYPPGSDS